MREQVLRKYVHAEHIYDIIGHNVWVHIKNLLIYGGVILLLRVVHYTILTIIDQQFLTTLWAAIGVGLYLKMIYEFLDEYLDCLVITDKWLVHFRRDGLWSQKVDLLSRVSIESVSHEENSLRDSLMWKWDLRIKLEDTVTTFIDVSDPSEVSNRILDFKDKILWRHNYLENEVRHEPDRLNVLVEALGEVVDEYVKKKNWESGYY